MNARSALHAILNRISDAGCEAIFNNLSERFEFGNIEDELEETFFVANSSDFREADHPRDNDGKFAVKTLSQGMVHPDNVRALQRDVKERKVRLEKAKELESYLTGAPGFRKPIFGGHSPYARKYHDDLDVAEIRLQGARQRQLSKKMTKLAQEYRETDETIDAIEEAYADRSEDGNGEKLKWPDTKQGREDRAKYGKLKRRLKELDKRIDWKLVNDDDSYNEEPKSDSRFAEAVKDMKKKGYVPATDIWFDQMMDRKPKEISKKDWLEMCWREIDSEED